MSDSTKRTRSIGWGKLLAFFGFTAAIVGVTYSQLDAASSYESPVASLVKLGMKFDGAQTCSAANCHGATGSDMGKKGRGLNSFTLWNGNDPHKKSFEVLSNDESKAMAEKLSIASATTSARCLSCHSVDAPAALHGEKFTLEEGNSCSTCHGPSEKWREPHATEGWTDKERAATGSHAAMLTKWGLFDTRPLVQRAERCSSCHLAIEPDLIAAGHPTPVFDLAYYSDPNYYTDRHWMDDETPYFHAKQWAVGQVVLTRDAMRQVAIRANTGASAESIKDAYDQAMAHFSVTSAMMTGMGFKADAVSGLAAKAADLEKAVAGGDKAAIAAAAVGIADAITANAAAANELAADKAKTVATMTAIAGMKDLATRFGSHGAEQQAWALYGLFDAFARNENPGDKDAVVEAIGGLFLEEGRKVPDGFEGKLAEVAGKLPK
jgi:hypothetical protein